MKSFEFFDYQSTLFSKKFVGSVNNSDRSDTDTIFPIELHVQLAQKILNGIGARPPPKLWPKMKN